MADPQSDQPPETATRESQLLRRTVLLAGLLITFAILWTANEIRYQGCVSLANDQRLAEVGYMQECSRLPWGA